jgi:hypothetical protein
VSDHIVGKGFRPFRETPPQDDAAAAELQRTGTGHPECPAFPRNVVLRGDVKPRIIDKVSLHFAGESLENLPHSIAKRLARGEGLKQDGENESRSGGDRSGPPTPGPGRGVERAGPSTLAVGACAVKRDDLVPLARWWRQACGDMLACAVARLGRSLCGADATICGVKRRGGVCFFGSPLAARSAPRL